MTSRVSPENASVLKRRRLPQHEFVQNTEYQEYSFCMYPDPGNAVSGICAMGRQWHKRDAEERAAEADITEVSNQRAYVGHPSVPVTPVCTVHGVEHDADEVNVRIYTIQNASGKDLQWYLCDQVAMQLELLPLP